MTPAAHVMPTACGVLLACALMGCDSQEVASTSPQPETSLERTVAVAPTTTVASPAEASSADSSGTSAAEAPAAKASSTAATVEPKGQTPSKAATAPAAAAASDTPRSPAIPAAAKIVGGIQEVTFDTIKLALEKDQPFDSALLTPAVKALDGQNIRIRGYIHPNVFRQTGITQFVLVRDNQQCCFGPGAALHDCIIVEMKPGKSTDFSVRPVTVEGRFTLVEWLDPDPEAARKHLAIYHLDGEKVQ